MDRYSHRLAYDIYMSIPRSQRSDYIRLAMILMHDRDEQIKRIKDILYLDNPIPEKEKREAFSEEKRGDLSEPAKNMLSFISQLNIKK
jgi:hypothetical protein